MALLYQVSYLFLVFLFCWNLLVSSRHLCDPKEQLALLEFKKSFSLSKYASWGCENGSYPKTETWKESRDCCSWDGVECDQGHVVELDLSCSFLNGTLHPNSTLFTLSHLQTLILSYNDFHHSPFSPQFGTFTNLRVLDLFHSGFEGEVPLEISHLSKLVSLHLSWNKGLRFSNVVMNQLVHNLTHLTDFALDGLDLSNVKPTSFMNLSLSLASLCLSQCSLIGNFPNHILGLPNLRVLDLNFNGELKGHLPVSNWSKSLEMLDLYSTNFSGGIPNSIGEATSLRHLHLSRCNFSGEIPEFQNHSNPLMGQVPNCPFNLTQDASSNFLLSPSIANVCSDNTLSNLIHLNLEGNSFTGTIPSWIYVLPRLKFLELSRNHFTTNFMRDFRSNSLEYLALSNSNLQGEISKSIYRQMNLTILALYNNNLSGAIDPSICQATNLKLLQLSNNNLSGAIPSCLFNMTNLSELLLDWNNFSGVIPVPPPRVWHYIASGNQFSGEIPPSICLAPYLSVLGLSNNRLSGTIPPCLAKMTSLQVLDLESNNFSGTVPATFSTTSRLISLDLNNNQIEGELPRSLLNCENLQVLDVGNNKITGHFPHWLEAASSLQVLILRSNRFYGHINNSMNKYSFPNVRIIDISYNNFNGSLPSNLFLNLRAMKEIEGGNSYPGRHTLNFFTSYYRDSLGLTLKGLEQKFEKIPMEFKAIDFSGNDFSGEIPKSIGMLVVLIGLNLAHNKLAGEIPTSFGNLTNLEWLDLSSNRLMGNIPSQLTALTFLSFLNLSQNQLSGPIPQGKQFDTFENSSYLGNLGLCGFPLPDCDPKKAHKSESIDEEEDDSLLGKGFWWRVVFMGYGCGMPFGMFVGFLVFRIGKPVWIVAMVEAKTRKKNYRTFRRNN